jgi:hypothetical protein
MTINASITDYLENPPVPLPEEQLIVIREECLKQTAFKLEADGVASDELAAIYVMLEWAIDEIVGFSGFEELRIPYIHQVLDEAIREFGNLDSASRRIDSNGSDVFASMPFQKGSVAEEENKKTGFITLGQCYAYLLTSGQLNTRHDTVLEVLRYALRHLIVVEGLEEIALYGFVTPKLVASLHAHQAFEDSIV